LLPIDMAGRYLGAVLDVLEAQHAAISVPVKASAVKALLKFVFVFYPLSIKAR
jgi:hypothetical protein